LRRYLKLAITLDGAGQSMDLDEQWAIISGCRGEQAQEGDAEKAEQTVPHNGQARANSAGSGRAKGRKQPGGTEAQGPTLCWSCRTFPPARDECPSCRAEQNREPGVEPDDPDPWSDKIDKHAAQLGVITAELRNMPHAFGEWAKLRDRLIQDVQSLKQFAQRRPKGELRRATCNRCGEAVLIVMSRKGIQFALDPQADGFRRGFEVKEGVAYYFGPGEAAGRVLYKAHSEQCKPNAKE
jgi:hypothetical protein